VKKYEIQEIDGKEITFDVSQLVKNDSIMVNATEIAKFFGKTPKDWLRTQDTKDYISALSSWENMPNENLVSVKQGGKHQGTWIHNKLAISFARWLNPNFAVQCDIKIRELLNEEQERKIARLESRTGYTPLSLAVFNSHDPLKGYHFSNEADMINRIVLGMTSKQFKEKYNIDSVRDYLDADTLNIIAGMQKYNTILIEMGREYKERKDELETYFVSKKNPQFIVRKKVA